jgi:GR25 family glycosyltransferase involved in LPS biosynthesis
MSDVLFYNYINESTEENAMYIIHHLLDNKFFNLALYISFFFYNLYPYNLDLLFNISVMLYNTKKYEESFIFCQKLLDFKNISEHMSKIFMFNSRMCIEYIKNNNIWYNHDLINNIVKRKIRNFPRITYTITTCKRFDLFEKTINSFINCCVDIDLIDKWICVDDNSNEEDRNKMQEKYPFFTFYMKTHEEKGHSKSMNIIRELVTTPYMFHMEDDWLFFVKKNYISNCLEVLQNNKKIQQCLINKNYSEISTDNISGGLFHTTYSGLRYFTHEYCHTDEEKSIFSNKYGTGSNCSYWPHYSLRPSLLYTSVLKKVGLFSNTAFNFEMEYAYRYLQKGYISAFLEDTYCIHIGKLTKDRNNKNITNAYDLNNEIQFGDKEVKIYQELKSKSFIINLKDREDRWNSLVERCPILKYDRYEGVNGNNVKPNHRILRLFDGNDYNMRAGIVGCALSHIKLYIELIKSEFDYYCIFEDDITFTDDYNNKLNHVICQLKLEKNVNWDIVYLGHFWTLDHKDKFVNNKKYPKIEKCNSYQESLRMSIGGCIGYMISKKGASKLLESINITGMTNAIDTIQQKNAQNLNIYYCYPHLIHSKCHVDGLVDSDIQYNFNYLSVTVSKRLEEEILFYENNITQITTLEEAIIFATTNQTNITYYYNEDKNQIEYILNNNIVHYYYTLDKNVIIFVPSPTEYHIKNRNFDKIVDGKKIYGRLNIENLGL